MSEKKEKESNLSKNVILKLSGLGKNFGVPEGVEVIYPGEYHFRNGTHYIMYDESSDAEGSVLDTKCILKMNEKRVEVIKHGAVSTNMIFAVGSPSVSFYQTGFGELSIATNVRSLDFVEEEHRICADMFYTLEINNDYAEECHLILTVTD